MVTGISQAGFWEFEDADGDGFGTVNDRQRLGSAFPDVTFSLTNTFKLNRFQVEFMFTGAFGHQIFNTYRFLFENPLTATNYNVTRSTASDEVSRLQTFNQLSSYYLEDGSYARLDYLTLRYAFQFKESQHIEDLELYVTGQNLLVLSTYDGLDPYVRIPNAQNGILPGIENLTTHYPTRTLLFGVRMVLK